MIKNEVYNIKSCDDFELDIKRKTLLNFTLTYDDEKDIKAIVCIIAGLGVDTSEEYRQKLAQSITSKLDVAVINANYHYISSDFDFDKNAFMDKIDKLIFRLVASKIGFKVDDDFERLADDKNYINELLEKLNLFIGTNKLQGNFAMDSRMNMHFTIDFGNGEYQNFGIMQGLDIINAILYVKKNKLIKASGGGQSDLPCILVGSSHGGYIANLAAKMAPWLIDAVVDNSSWNLKSEAFYDPDYSLHTFRNIGFGKEFDFLKYKRLEIKTENFTILLSDKTNWTSNPDSPYYMSKSRFEIRDINHKEHLKIQANAAKCVYRGYHSSQDLLAPCKDKLQFYENLQKLGCNATLHLIKSQDEVDGKLIKNLEHGLNMSIKTLILKEIPPLLRLFKNFKKPKMPKQISYPCEEFVYIFKENRGKIEARCEKNILNSL